MQQQKGDSMRRKCTKETILFIISSFMIFILIYLIAFFVPVHSDDYGYLMKGFSLKPQIAQYLKWNGRFLVNYTASIVLNLFKRWVYMAINSFFLLVLIILITILPNIIMKKKIINSMSFVILWLIFTLYWLANPNLGQTSFWFVGSVNYLWTLVWAGAFFSSFLYLLVNRRQLNIRNAVILSILGLFAGLSTESLGITVVLFVMCMFPLFWKENKATLFTGLFASGIGYAILFFSPGQAVRSQSDAFEEWRNLPAYGKLLEHIYTRMPIALGRFYLLYNVTIVLLCVVLLFHSEKETDRRLFVFPLLFTLLSFLSILAYIIAPTMPPRGQNVCVFYGLLALSFTVAFLAESKIGKRGIALSAVTLICILYFIPSFLFISHAYRQTKVQAEIRKDIIRKEKKAGNSKVTIPDWYFTRLLKNGDKFDTFRPRNMAKYYNLEALTWKDVGFNYASIRTLPPIKINKKLKDGLILKNIYVAFNLPFEQTLVLEFNRDLREFCDKDEITLFLHLFLEGYDKSEDSADCINLSIDLNNYVQDGNSFFYGKSILTPDISTLDKIELGLHDPDTKTTSVKYNLDFKNYYNPNK